MLKQVVVQLIAGTPLQDQPYQALRHYNLVKTRDVWMEELAVVVDFAGEVGIVLLRALEYNLGAIGELVGGKVDLAEAALANEAAESSSCQRYGGRGRRTRSGGPDTSWRAKIQQYGVSGTGSGKAMQCAWGWAVGGRQSRHERMFKRICIPCYAGPADRIRPGS